MSRGDDSAFPVAASEKSLLVYGLTIREHFAGLAMQGLLASGGNDVHANFEFCASNAVSLADAIIAELSKVSS
jgi:hypothetical protein